MTAAIVPIHIFRDDLRFHYAIRAHSNALQVASMVTFRVLKAVLLAIRIEMTASGFEIWRIAFCVLVNVDCVFSRGRSCKSNWITMPSLSYMSAEPTFLPFASFNLTVTLALLVNDRAKRVRDNVARRDRGVFMTAL